MYAVFETGGKQYRAIKGATVRIEKLPYVEGESLEWKGFCFSEEAGMQNVVIKAEPLGVFREPKVLIFKKTQRHTYRRKQGHRQNLLWAKIQDISIED
jgi:large subunit ribosomal protein L21